MTPDQEQPGEFVMVPREPTQAMLNAPLLHDSGKLGDVRRRAWKAMLAASPAPTPADAAPPEPAVIAADRAARSGSADARDAARWRVVLACVRQDSDGGWVVHEDDPHNADGTKALFTAAIDAAISKESP